MIEIKTKEFEKRLGLKVKKNFKSVGWDCASRTGWALVKEKEGSVILDYGFIDINSPNSYFKYDEYIKIFDKLIKEWQCTMVVEDTFFGHNVNVLKMLSRIGMIVYVLARLNKLPVSFILPGTARAKLKFKGNAKKEFVHKQIEDRLKLGLKDVDCIDAVVLALCGIVEFEEMDI